MTDSAISLEEKLELSEASPYVKLTNPYLGEVEYLYHLGLSTDDHIAKSFHDVKVWINCILIQLKN